MYASTLEKAKVVFCILPSHPNSIQEAHSYPGSEDVEFARL